MATVKKIVKKGFPNQGLTFCRPDKRQPRIGKIEGTHCSCGYRRRGPNHDKGSHHNSPKKDI